MGSVGHGANRAGILKEMNRASQGIIIENLSRWKGEREGDSSEEDDSMLAGDTDDSKASQLKVERRWSTKRFHHPKNKVCKLLQMPITFQGWQVKWKMRRLIISDGSRRAQAQQCVCALQMEQVLEGSLLEALWFYMCVP